MVCARPSSDVPKLLYLLKKLRVNFVTKGHGYGYFYGSHILDVFIGVLLVEHKILGGESLSESHKLNLQNVHSIQFTANCIDLKTQKNMFYFAPNMVVIVVARNVNLFGVRDRDYIRTSV